MAYKSLPHLDDTRHQANIVQQSLQSSTGNTSPMEDPAMHRFAAVLAQLKHGNIASLVSSIRQGDKGLGNEHSSSSTMTSMIGCKVLSKPLYGSYHLAYRVLFEDGVDWILKIPENGHHTCFDRLAVEALTSEALTMRMIKKTTTIPVPAVHHFDASSDNEIGCPYILMDFLKGKPVWQGWFDGQASISKLEQFRARSLQTIAAAMVQLSQFTLDRGGSLRFDSDGRPVDVAGAKVPDWVAEQDAMRGLRTLSEGCPYCEKGPVVDAASSLLFMLNRRGSRETDQAYDRGVHEALRLFTDWTLEKVEGINNNGPQFVLAHPDFALQNFLVEDDGTLCGVIDWDGVAAVPLSVGCLKYPDWLMNDWHPWYDYNPEELVQHENSPEELAAYRNMYAQFVEVLSSITCGSSKSGKSNANLTRMSLVAGSLGLAANDLKLTDDTVDIIFGKLEALTTENDDSDVSDSDSDSSVETTTKYKEEEDGASEIAPMESENSFPGVEGKSDPERLCSECIAKRAPDQPSTDNVDEESTGMLLIRTEAATGNKEGVGSRKAKVAIWALDLGEKGCRGISKVFHKGKVPKSQPIRKPRVVKWALGLGEEGCKRASKAFHMKEPAANLQPKNFPEAVPAQTKSWPASKLSKVAIGLCDRSETLVRKITARLHRHSMPRVGPSPKGTKMQQFQIFLKQFIGLLKMMIWEPMWNDADDTQTPRGAEITFTENPSAKGPLSTKIVLVDTEHCRRCNPVAEARGRETQNDGAETTKIDSENVWASIAAEVDKGGVPISLIIMPHDVIAQCVMQDLGQEMEREKEQELHLKYQKAARKAKATKANHRSSKPGPSQHSAFTDPENAAYPEFIVIAPGHPEAEIVDPDTVRPYDDKCEPSESESLISKLEAAKQRFDMEMALKGQSSTSASLEPRDAGAAILQYGISKPQTSVYDVVNLEATEEANRKLRMALLSFAKPKATNSHLESNKSQVLEGKGAARQKMRPERSYTSSKHTMSSAAIELANGKLRTVLASFQTPEAANTDLRHDLFQGEKGETEELKSDKESQTSLFTLASDACSNIVATQPQKAIAGGWWFETPRGSLKRLDDEEKPIDGVDGQELISPPGSFFSDINGGSSKSSVASRENKSSAKVSDFQLICPNHSPSETLHIFQLPDNEEEEEEYDAARLSDDEDGGGREELEDGEIDEEAQSSVDNVPHGEGEELPGEEVDTAAATDNSKEWEKIDSSHFAMSDVCVALGHGNLDEQRMKRLKEGFMALLDDAVGVY